MNLDTYEIQLDTVGAEAVQQTLDALGVKTDAIDMKSDEVQATGTASAASPDLTALLAGQAETNALLARIAAALERQSSNKQAVY